MKLKSVVSVLRIQIFPLQKQTIGLKLTQSLSYLISNSPASPADVWMESTNWKSFLLRASVENGVKSGPAGSSAVILWVSFTFTVSFTLKIQITIEIFALCTFQCCHRSIVQCECQHALPSCVLWREFFREGFLHARQKPWEDYKSSHRRRGSSF